MHYIYITTNIINGKKYIGQRKCPDNKIPKTDPYLGSGTALIKAINKYGKDNFTKEIFRTCQTQKQADRIETKLIIRHNACDDDMYYNISCGGQNNRSENHSEITSKVMSNFYKDDYNYTSNRIKVNRQRYLNGLKPTFYTIAERDLHNLRLKFTKEHNDKQRAYKNKVKALAKSVWRNSEAYNTIKQQKYDDNKGKRIDAGAMSWQTNRDGRIASMRDTWDKRKTNGYVVDNDYKRKLAIAKLELSGNYLGLYLVNNGMVNILSIRGSMSNLLSRSYKDIRNYTKQLDNVCQLINSNDVPMTVSLLHELVSKSRLFKGLDVYYIIDL